MMGIVGTLAIHVTCPTCGAQPGCYCRGQKGFCQARISAAAKRTRDANRKERQAKGKH